MRARHVIQAGLYSALLAAGSPPAAALADEPQSAPTPAHPSDSVYHVDEIWDRAGGGTLRLSEFAGHPVIVVMFYGTCQHACPILMRDAQHTLAAVPEPARADVRVVLVTINPAGDSLEELAQLAVHYGLGADQWAILRGSDLATRTLAAVLGVQYRDDGAGQISHSNFLTLLDRAGRIVHQTEGLGRPVEPLVEALVALPPR